LYPFKIDDRKDCQNTRLYDCKKNDEGEFAIEFHK
jgi:hypothetical protein